MRLFCVTAICASILVSACSVRPIPDDVSPIPTEEIVRSMRCETKFAVRAEIQKGLKIVGLPDIVPDLILDPKNLARIRQRDKERGDNFADRILAYGVSSIAYAFDFYAAETNNLEANLGFKLPLTNGNFDLGASGKFNRLREGKRVFQTVETFSELAKLHCGKFEVREKNLAYPITGSIGMTKAVETFVSLSELGGAEKLFTDTLTFTTTLSASLTPKLTLTPIPKSFRLASLDATALSGRTDVHKVTISFAFPDMKKLRQFATADIALQQAATKQIALENLCIARATDREDQTGNLRLYPPETYCRPASNGASPTSTRAPH